MPFVYFHDLPVYRLSEEAYYQARDKWIAAFVTDARKGLGPSPEREKQLTKDMEQHHYDISSGVEKVEIHRIRIGRCVARMAARWFARAEQACRRARRRKGSAFRRASERQALRAGRP
jgi:hypothetical protein